MFLYFKKRKFRNFIKECGILKDEKVRAKSWFGDLYYINRGLKRWEKKILREEIDKIVEERQKREEKESRKKFFDTWKSK